LPKYFFAAHLSNLLNTRFDHECRGGRVVPTQCAYYGVVDRFGLDGILRSRNRKVIHGNRDRLFLCKADLGINAAEEQYPAPSIDHGRKKRKADFAWFQSGDSMNDTRYAVRSARRKRVSSWPNPHFLIIVSYAFHYPFLTSHAAGGAVDHYFQGTGKEDRRRRP
jgi:hypothetical protein